MDSNHPVQQFSFDVLTRDVDRYAAELRTVLLTLADSREWVIAPPALCDIPDMDGCRAASPDSKATDTDSEEDEGCSYPLQGYLDLYSATKGPPLPYDVERRHFEEVTALIHQLELFSIKHGLEIEFYLGRTFVGKIVWGLQDSGLRDTLLGEWARVLELEKPAADG